MRVCFVCSEYPPFPWNGYGGIGTSTQHLARALVAGGHEVRVVGMYRDGDSTPSYEEDEGVRVWRMRLPNHWLGWLRARYRLYRVISKWVGAGALDLVDVPDWEGWAAGWPKLTVPVITRLCGARSYFLAEMGQPLDATMFRLERASLRRSDFWCSKSVYMANRVRTLFGLPDEPDAILHNPVDVPTEGSAARCDRRVVFTGTLTAKKGVVPLIQAWSKVVQTQPSAELHLFGKDSRWGDEESMKEYLLSELDESTRRTVHFHGHVSRTRVVSELLQAGVAVFPSFAEGFANGPLEAMACGCATIYSLRGSGPELIEHGKCGLLADPDRVDDIAAAIERLLGNRALARELGSAGQAVVRERFSTGNVLSKNLEFYERCRRRFVDSRPHLKKRPSAAATPTYSS